MASYEKYMARIAAFFLIGIFLSGCSGSDGATGQSGAAGPSGLRAPRIATIGEITVTAVPAVRAPVRFLSAIVGAVVAGSAEPVAVRVAGKQRYVE